MEHLQTLSDISIGVTIGNYEPVSLSLASMSDWYPTDTSDHDDLSPGEAGKYWLADLSQATTTMTWKVADLHDSRYYRCAHGYETDCSKSTAVAGIEDPLLVMAFSGIDWLEDGPDISNTKVCALDLCLRSYEITVQDNQPLIKQVDIAYGVKNIEGPQHTGARQSAEPFLCWMSNNSSNPQYMND